MKTIGIYPGSFQPAHRGHFNAFKKLKQIVGPDVFVVTTDKTPTPEAPLNFGEKEQILIRHGIPGSYIIKVQDWKHPMEVFHKFSAAQTNVIFSLNHKEMEEVARHKSVGAEDETEKEIWTNMDGTPSYFQPYKGNEHAMKPLNVHGYAILIEDNIIDGKPISTANIRDGIGSPKYSTEQKKKFFMWAFGWFDIGLFQMVSTKLKLAHKTAEVEPVAPVQPSMKLKDVVKEILGELSGPPPSSTPAGEDTQGLDLTSDGELPDETERRKAAAKTKLDASKQKAQSERDLKSLQADAKWKEADLTRKKKDEIPNKRKEIDALNKQMSARTF